MDLFRGKDEFHKTMRSEHAKPWKKTDYITMSYNIYQYLMII